MATVLDLMGVGMPAALANFLGRSSSAVTCAGTTSGTATTLQNKIAVLTAAGSATGVILPAGASIGSAWFLTNPSATTAVLYPPAGNTFDTSGSTSLNIAQYNSVIAVRTTSTTWMTIVSA